MRKLFVIEESVDAAVLSTTPPLLWLQSATTSPWLCKGDCHARVDEGESVLHGFGCAVRAANATCDEDICLRNTGAVWRSNGFDTGREQRALRTTSVMEMEDGTAEGEEIARWRRAEEGVARAYGDER